MKKKLYAVKEDCGRIWETELDICVIKDIRHYGAGHEMCTDEITITFIDDTELEVDAIIVK